MMDSTNETQGGILPDRDRVLEDVKQIVAEQISIAMDGITPRSALVEDLGCDSLDIVEISMELEEHFDITIPDDVGEQMRTIGEVTDGVLQLLAGRAPSSS
jgi:acyl carrier protein